MIPSFEIQGKVVVVTGGGGVICGGQAKMCGELGAKVAVLDLFQEAADRVAAEINENGGEAIGVACNVLEKSDVEAACASVLEKWGRVDVLINGAGGNKPAATTNAERNFFDLPADALQWVLNLNLLGTILPSQVFGKAMAESGEGTILNLSSMNAFRPLTRIPAYSAAKAAINNFTQWLAVDIAMNFSPKIRVNAIAPGFFVGNQNRDLLYVPGTTELTPRGRQIVSHTPMGRFGEFEELLGATLYLISPASNFVTGVVLPIDGGFSSYTGV
ncbi:D-mannonate oxidoreductase [Anaerolineaceae bacterium oral taxon 439]|nr:D-mannonate oxidoreductase [Anaerolineaceae bacterium oral taxon 439]